jgi:hypothetical protein
MTLRTIVTVTFVPIAPGTRSASLSFAYSVAGSPQTLALNGTGVAGTVSLSTPALVFSQQLGASSAAQTVILSNTGSNAVSIGSILLSAPMLPISASPSPAVLL